MHIAVAGVGDGDTGGDIVPSPTTVHAPLEDLGRIAIDAVTARERTDPPPLPVQVRLRDSTPRARGDRRRQSSAPERISRSQSRASANDASLYRCSCSTAS